MDRLWQELIYGFRMLLKNPGFTLLAVLTLALGIGANTAIFSLVDAFLLKQLPVNNPQQLVFVESVSPDGRHTRLFPYSSFERFYQYNRVFSGIFAWDSFPATVIVENQPEMNEVDFVTSDYFRALNTSALHGQLFIVDDDQPDKEAVAVVSYRFWKQRLSGDAAAVGKTIRVGKIPVRIIGITKDDFLGRTTAGRTADVILPMSLRTQIALVDRGVQMMARMKPDINSEQARAELDSLYQQLLKEEVPQDSARQMRARNIALKLGNRGEASLGDFEETLRLLMLVVGLVLLVACVNVANLLLSRAATRQREIAIRFALGASRARLLRQFLIESCILALLGGAIGLLFAIWGVNSLTGILSYGQSAPIPFEFTLNTKILAFTSAASLLTGILSGLAPALTAERVNLVAIMKGLRAGKSSLTTSQRLPKLLVIAQVALSVALLIGAGLLIRTLRQLNLVDTGFDRAKVMTMWVYPSAIGYDPARELHLYDEVLEKLNGITGVESASLSLSSIDQGAVLIGPRFFQTEGIGLLVGREFSSADTANTPKVAIISESLARQFFPNENPIGQHFGYEPGGGFHIQPHTGDIQVVGVARDIRPSLWEQEWLASFYLPYTQAPLKALGRAELLIRAAGKPTSLIPTIRQEFQSVEKDLALVNIKTQAEEMNEKYLSRVQPVTTLLSCFSALAVILTVIGIYGIVSYAVAQRTQEFGIRMALGAQLGDVLQLVVGQGMRMVLIGIACGLLGAYFLTRLLKNLLFGVSTTDPLTFSVVGLLLLLVALLACSFPALRATKVDPIEALRHE